MDANLTIYTTLLHYADYVNLSTLLTSLLLLLNIKTTISLTTQTGQLNERREFMEYSLFLHAFIPCRQSCSANHDPLWWWRTER